MGKPVDYSIFQQVWEKEYTITRQLYRNCCTVRPGIAKHERGHVADPLMFHHVQVNIETVRAQNGAASLQLLP